MQSSYTVKKFRMLCACLVVMLAGLFLLTSCGKKEAEDRFNLFYIRSDKTGIYPISYDLKNVDTESCVHEVLMALSEDTGKVEYIKTIPTSVNVTDFTISNGVLSLYFSRSYLDMEKLTEILTRAAIVRTVTQIDGINSVSFYVAGKPLENADGNAVGPMSAARFVSDFSSEALVETTINLYFSTYDGKTVMPEKRKVYYSSNVSLDHVVLDQLMSGPDDDKLLSAMPAEVRLLSVSTTSRTCYVNFSEAFQNPITGLTDNVVVYSVVNSLTELPDIDNVVITVNGNLPVFATKGLDLSKPLSKNNEIINAKADSLESAPTSGVLDVLHGTGVSNN